MSCKVSNQTNSQDPQAVNSRIFVGNLNTFQCSKTDVERRFQRYGRIAGISMHKGYAFIQFTNPFDARSACLGENARFLWGQTLDVNMVAEPKAHQTGRKRQNIAKTGNDWDFYYDSMMKMQLESDLTNSYYAQVGLPAPPPRLMPPMKRPRIHVPANPFAAAVSAAAAATNLNSTYTTTPIQIQQPPQPKHRRSKGNNNNSNNNNSSSSSDNKSQTSCNNVSISELKTYSTPDILICGNCRELFSEIEQLMQHKQTYCKLRFTCKCHMLNGFQPKAAAEEPASLLCSQCKESFQSAWDLMVHVQTAHLINIYELGSDSSNGDHENETEEQEQQQNGEDNINASLLAILGSSNGEIESSATTTTSFVQEIDDDNQKCDNSCQTTSFLENNENNHSPEEDEEKSYQNGLRISNNNNPRSVCNMATTTTAEGLSLPGANGTASQHHHQKGGNFEGTTKELEVVEDPMKYQSTKINGVLNNNNNNNSFPKETSTQTLGCQTDQQILTTTSNSTGFEDHQQDCTATMLNSIKVEDGPHVVKFLTGTV